MAGKKVAVIFGGPSSEHEVSLRSAETLVPALLESGCSVCPVLWTREASWVFGPWLDAKNAAPNKAIGTMTRGIPVSAGRAAARIGEEADVVFPAVHGEFGEDGRLQGFLEVLGVPFVGSGVLGSALCMDKVRSKRILEGVPEIRLLPSEEVSQHDWNRHEADVFHRLASLRLPCIVKPVCSGSSVGLKFIDSLTQFADAMRASIEESGDDRVLVEEFATGVEVTCVVLGDPEREMHTLPPILIRPKKGVLFDYEAKYTVGASEEICPAPIAAESEVRVRAATESAFRALGASGLARADFILADFNLGKGIPYFLELNTLPGLTQQSLLPLAARTAGLALPRLFFWLIELALGEETSLGLARTAAPR